jgi:aerobic carbon-monoxide dehydrogenase medium subunit
VGALTSYDELLSLPEEFFLPMVLRECAAAVGDVQIRNAGTIGGAVAHGDTASDFAAGVIAADARFVLRSPQCERAVAAEDFFLGPFATVLTQQELLVELRVRPEAAGEGSAYVAFEDPASGYPLAGAAVYVEADGGCRVGLTGVGEQPLRAVAVEEAIAAGQDLGDAFDALGLPVAGDDPDHTRQLSVVAITRALEAARTRSAA